MARKPRPKPTDDLSPNQKRSILRYKPDDGACVVREADNQFAVYYVAVVKIGVLDRPPGAYVYRTPDGQWFNEAWQAAAHLSDTVEVSVRQTLRKAAPTDAAPPASKA